MTEAKTKKARAPRKKKLDLPTLQRLADEAAEYVGKGNLLNLRHRWEAEEGCKISDAGIAGTKISMAGITATCTAGVNGAISNWAAAARRAIRKG